MDSLTKGLESMRQTMANLDLENPLLAGLAAIVVTVFFLFLMRIWRGLTNKFRARLQDVGSSRLKPLRFQNLDILSTEDIASLLEDGLKVLYWLGAIVLVLLNLNLVFGIFPATRGLVAAAIGIVTTALSTMLEEFVAYLPKLAVIIVTALAAYYAIRLARLIFRGLATKRITIRGFYPEWAMPTYGLVRLIIIAVAFVLVLPNLPAAQSPAFRGVSIFVAVLVSLGSTAAVGNMVAGVVLTYTRAFKIGDLVRIADTLGKVQEKTLFVTRVTTPKNVEIAIPNAMVLANHIINYSSLARREPGLVLHTTVTIGYDVPQEKVRDLLVEAAGATENIEPEPAPFVLVSSLDDFYVSYEINAHTRQARTMTATYSELHGHIIDNFNEAGIEIMSPHYSAIRDGNPIALPKDHLPKNYEPAPFTFKPLEGLLGRKRQD